ncbi:MAG: hypothetical protein ACFFCS_29590 [Candidatus Hodarchaeota archaeon]
MASQSESEFRSVQILNNFYQTSSFFPMPVVLMSTISESGKTNIGPYSLCFPYEVSGKGKKYQRDNVITPEFLDTLRDKRAKEKGAA